MRIISGELKRYRFNPPKGFPSRPTTDFAKEGLFNLLVNRLDMQNLECLDLFTGTGNISFELASRQAGNIIAIDKNYKCIRFIQNFIQQHQWNNRITIFKSDAIKFIERCNKTFDFIFADPPYTLNIHNELIEKIFTNSLLKPDGIFVLEHGEKLDFSTHPYFDYVRKYGHVYFSFFTLKNDGII